MVGCTMTGWNGEVIMIGGSTTLGGVVAAVMEAILFSRVGEDGKTICKV